MNSLVTIVFVVAALWFGYQVGESGSYKKGWGDGYYEGNIDGISMMESQAILENKAIINGEYGFIWK
jgi:hypothetical protein